MSVPAGTRTRRPAPERRPLALRIAEHVKRRIVPVQATGRTDHVAPGDLAVLERRALSTKSLVRLADDLGRRGAIGLVVHEELLASLDPAERIVIEERISLLSGDTDWQRTAARLLEPTSMPAGSDPEAVLRAVLRGEAPGGSLPDPLDVTRPTRALAVLAHPGEHVPLPISKLEEVVATEALLGDPRAHALTIDGIVVAFTGNYGPNGEDLDGLGRTLVHRARAALLLSEVTVGIGRQYSGAQGLRRTYREAVWAAMVAEALWGGNRAVTFRQLGVYGLLQPFVADPSTADTEDIETLMDYDRQNHTALLPTVEAFFEAGSAGEAAAQLFVHRNTIAYRLRAVKRVTGLDIVGDADARLLLEIQLRLARLRGLLPPGPAPRVR